MATDRNKNYADSGTASSILCKTLIFLFCGRESNKAEAD